MSGKTSWYKLSLAGDIEKVNQAAWQSAWEVSKAKATIEYGSAIFKKISVRDGLSLYFTPSAQSLAETFGATPCRKPSPKGLSLFIGSQRAWRIHFPLTFWMRSTGNAHIDAHPPEHVESIWPSHLN